MSDIKQEWTKTQLHWDDKGTIKSRRIPKSLIFNWRNMTSILQSLCKEKRELQDIKLTMIDIGCGAGKFYNGLELSVSAYIGIDPSDKMLSYAVRDHNQFFIRGVGEHIPVKAGIADVILLKSMLDQCYAPDQLISESYRVLKGGGWLLISLSNRDSYYAFFRKIYNRLKGYRGDHFFQESHQFYFDMMDMITMLKKGGFKIVRQIPIGYFIFPRFMEWMIPERLLPRFIYIADKAGSVILPHRGGGFIFVGQTPEKRKET